jgi:hypothetical protein
MHRTPVNCAMSSKPPVDHVLCARVWAEFREMPELTLTLPEAARLFSLDRARCAHVLDALVVSGALTTDGVGFARADSGRLCGQGEQFASDKPPSTQPGADVNGRSSNRSSR